jgi:O-antigen/teichoic acid export membrane protein
MIGLAAVAKPLIIILIGLKWLPAAYYLELICFSAMLYPLHALNLNILIIKGRTDLYLKIEIIKKILAIPVIFVSIFLGIKSMLIGFILLSIVAYYFNSNWSGRLINYSAKEQLLDIFPSLLLAIVMGAIVYSLSLILFINNGVLLFSQILVGIVVTIILSKIFKLDSYIYIKEIVFLKASPIHEKK